MFDVCSLSPDPAALLADAADHGVLIFGAGGFARSVRAALTYQGVTVHAHVVTSPAAVTLDGVPVWSLAALAPEARRLPLWVGVYNRNAASDLADIATACRARGIKRILLPQDYYEVLAEQLGWRFWLTDRRDYAPVGAQLAVAHASLADDQSRAGFDATLRFRAGGAIGAAPRPTADAQYFPPEVQAALAARGTGCVFVDGGAYDGDTITQAAAALPLGHACAFEPDLANFARLAANLADLGVPVTAFPCGLSAANEWLAFAADHGEGSAINADGPTRVQCVRLDDCLIGERVDYIKLDVEGHELAALTGMAGIITRDRPVLAIAAYHRWDDLWRIPSFISELGAGYRLLYRTHEHNTFDSVFYALP